MNADDTIAAISTPPGRGGIGIVRISGPRSLAIASILFHAESGHWVPAANQAYVGRVRGADGEDLDYSVATYFKGPRSYTGEDVVEFGCHGSPLVLRTVLDLALGAGARMAEPGEFTLRAFLNGRIDLSQAQAVRDLIDAQTMFQARIAMRQMEGSMAAALSPVKRILIDAAVHLESSIEFVEDDITPEARSSLTAKLGEARETLGELERTFSVGRLVREGFDLAIVGRPNVGKSSVFNRLVGSERAIVTEVPGTTRDALREHVSISGIPVRLIDTAGIRETSDPIEQIGIDRSRRAIADADVSLVIFDRSEPIALEEIALLESIPKGSRLVLMNKCDLPAAGSASLGESAGTTIEVSALTGRGFDKLIGALLDLLGAGAAAEHDDAIITDARQHQAIRRATDLLSGAMELMEGGELEEIVLLRLRGALAALGELTGETLTDDILAQIFSTFCIGK
ncbi:MAG TPA: tRNA uridine-5-carboxymethylaminomethyl(34) synthesis GTPase MnmE [Blastocatellia bacterium]